LFSTMYKSITDAREPGITAARAAKALQAAQIASWRSGTERAKAGYWSAVFIAGKH
jgi:hypothetical protein